LEVFDIRLADFPPEYGARLRHRRDIVAMVYSDFVAKLPDAKLTALASRAAWVDGRTEESQYPNLMIPGAMLPYGI